METEVKVMTEEDYARRAAELRAYEESTKEHNRKVARESSWLCAAFQDISKKDRISVLRSCYFETKALKQEQTQMLEHPA